MLLPSKIDNNSLAGSLAGDVEIYAPPKKFIKNYFVVLVFIFCSLVFTTSSANPPDWIPEVGLQYSMQIVCKVELEEGVFSQDPSDILGAFVGTECRGLASPLPDLEGFYFLSVGSNLSQGETVSFKVYLEEQDQVFNTNETLIFEHLGEIGDLSNPFIFSLDNAPPLYFTIEASSSEGGSISPEGDILVEYGFDQEFTFLPLPGYVIANVMVDGINLGDIPSYIFEEVAQDHSIHVDFQEINLIIEARAGDNGSIFPSGMINVPYGESKVFEISPDIGFQIEDVIVDNLSQGPVTHFVFDNVTENHSITASFTVVTVMPEANVLNHLKVYPNPAEDRIALQLAADFFQDVYNSRFWVLDLFGQTVSSGEIFCPMISIDMSHLKSGTYILRFESIEQSQLILKK